MPDDGFRLLTSATVAAQLGPLQKAQATQLGFNPDEYAYLKDEPAISFTAVLDFRVWAKNGGVNCCFREIQTGRKFFVTAFNNQHSNVYTPRDGKLDFSAPGMENGIYRLRVERSTTNKPVWSSAHVELPPEPQDAVLAKIRELRNQ